MSCELKRNLKELKLDYPYWEEINPYYTPSGLVDSTKIGLNHAKKAENGLNDAIAQRIHSNADLITNIRKIIRSKICSKLYSEDDLLLIFDLIQAWGGRMCKNPYVQPKDNIYRNQK